MAELELGLGNTHYAQGEFEEAEEWYTASSATVGRTAFNRLTETQMVPVLLNRALVQLAKREHGAALILLTRAHRLAQCVLGADKLDVACILHNTGKIALK